MLQKQEVFYYIVQVISLFVFWYSLSGTIELVSTLVSKNRVLTEKGFRKLGVRMSLLIISGLQLFRILDFCLLLK